METVESEIQQFGVETGIVVWEGIPWGGATTLSPESQTLHDFLTVARAVGSPILYVDPDGSAAAFATGGVVHVFATPSERARLVGDTLTDGEDQDWYGEEGEDLPSARVAFRVAGAADYDDPYFDWQSRNKVDGKVREAIDALVADSRYDGYRADYVVAEHVAGLDVEEAGAVERVASRVFDEQVGKHLDHRAKQLVHTLVKDPSYDPLAWGPETRAFIDERVNDDDPRLIERLERELSKYAYESGAREAAERELTRRAESVLLELSPLERDQLGFASRNAAKMQLLESYLEGESDTRAERLAREVANVEQDRFGLHREERYATAARRLLAGGKTRAAASRWLGISTSVIDRIVATHRADVELAPDDPLVTEIAPGNL